jgi:YD repeat-containing protein
LKPIQRVWKDTIGLPNDPSGAQPSLTQYQYGAIQQGYGYFGVDSRTNYVTDPNGNQTQLIYSYPNPYYSTDDGAVAGLQITGPGFYGADGGTPNVWLQGWLPDISHPTSYQLTDPLGAPWGTSFDGYSQPLTIVDPMTHQTTLTWNGTDLASLKDPTNLLWQFGYAAGGRLNQVTDPANRVLTTATYNGFGQAQSVTIPAAVSATGLDQTETMTYDPNTGDLTAVVGATGDQGMAGLLNPSTHAITPGSDYDAFGDLLGFSVFPDTGSPLTSLTPLSSTIVYNATQMPVQITSPTGSSIAYDYTNGVLTDFRLLSPQNAPLSQVQFQHDTHGRVYHAQDSVGSLFSLVYDRNSNVTQFRDGNGSATGFGYGSNDEPTGLNWPDGHSTSVLYNSLGLVRQATEERGIVANYAYDPAWRLQSVAIPSDPNRNVSFTYDDASRLLSAADAAGNAVTYQYNPADKRLHVHGLLRLLRRRDAAVDDLTGGCDRLCLQRGRLAALPDQPARRDDRLGVRPRGPRHSADDVHAGRADGGNNIRLWNVGSDRRSVRRASLSERDHQHCQQRGSEQLPGDALVPGTARRPARERQRRDAELCL